MEDSEADNEPEPARESVNQVKDSKALVEGSAETAHATAQEAVQREAEQQKVSQDDYERSRQMDDENQMLDIAEQVLNVIS